MTPEQLDSLVDEQGGALYKFCCKLAGNRADADDLYQETFLKAVEQPHKIDTGRNPQAYLISVAVFLWKSRWRKMARRQRIAPRADFEEAAALSDGPGLIDSYIAWESAEAVRRAVDGLDDKFRIPLYLYYTLEMHTGDIALALKIPGGTVKSRLHKGRQLVKEQLEGGADGTKRSAGAAL